MSPQIKETLSLFGRASAGSSGSGSSPAAAFAVSPFAGGSSVRSRSPSPCIGASARSSASREPSPLRFRSNFAPPVPTVSRSRTPSPIPAAFGIGFTTDDGAAPTRLVAPRPTRPAAACAASLAPEAPSSGMTRSRSLEGLSDILSVPLNCLQRRLGSEPELSAPFGSRKDSAPVLRCTPPLSLEPPAAARRERRSSLDDALLADDGAADDGAASAGCGGGHRHNHVAAAAPLLPSDNEPASDPEPAAAAAALTDPSRGMATAVLAGALTALPYIQVAVCAMKQVSSGVEFAQALDPTLVHMVAAEAASVGSAAASALAHLAEPLQHAAAAAAHAVGIGAHTHAHCAAHIQPFGGLHVPDCVAHPHAHLSPAAEKALHNLQTFIDYVEVDEPETHKSERGIRAAAAGGDAAGAASHADYSHM
eukprot:tig00001479_g8902.t1